MLSSINNISPIDGRYKKYTEQLNAIFSESAFIKHRILIEIKYFIFLLKFNTKEFPYNEKLHKLMDTLYNDTNNEDTNNEDTNNEDTNNEHINNDNINIVKNIENKINHDVKSIEYFLANILKENSHENYVNLLHFGLTSQDINTTAYSISIKDFNDKIFLPEIAKLFDVLTNKITDWNKTVMLGRTHGQPATWTLLGKEFDVFYYKIFNEIKVINEYKFTTKFSGAVGNMTSHKIFAEIDWYTKIDEFIKEFGLERTLITTQIHNYNEFAQYFDILKRICSILIDMCVDIWIYCSFGELKLNKPKEHVGSSIMPHKVNPIEFENAEGNLKIAEMWLEFLSRELCKSRLQRDLTDSTILRNLGVVCGHIIIGIKNITKGLNYLEENKEVIEENLRKNIASMSEIDQHILRKSNNKEGYNTIKQNINNNNKNNYTNKELDQMVKYYKNFILPENS
jgi:adenylosuccinate lyase